MIVSPIEAPWYKPTSKIIEEIQYAVPRRNEHTISSHIWESSCSELRSFEPSQESSEYYEEYSLSSEYEDALVDDCKNGNILSLTSVIRNAVRKAGVEMEKAKRRVSRQFLTNLNIAQLRLIVNDLQRYTELLNDELVQLLMKRDELQMSQDATLIDIEDLSLYF
ncbi:uncharacterized protein LOC129780412 isoform X2 [Toxorhynchites rutilus septentrionalis]|uniref:uncharacterized protein LOC129780412 isoform X2 n=1 Tax=Toxorhynchites rutilus septentrionalis TaxID=329112 RepID=UPI00247A3218|nr:uncharacterized protein LOC129780412 isoform X2 [Toxorhynchites rutilus septentrionalis]